MPAPEIQISKDGLKLSYQRYMADSAAGFVVILGAVFAISKGIPLPLFGHSLEGIIRLSSQAQLFVCLISFLLATPIGLFVNALSWFLIGWSRIYLFKLWFRLPEKWYNPLFPTRIAFHYDKLSEFFKINDQFDINQKSIYEISALYGKYINLFFQDSIKIEEHVTGLARFVRNLACLSLLSIFLCLHMMFWYSDTIYGTFNIYESLFTLLFLIVFLILLYSLLGSFSCLKTLSTVYILCIARGISNDNPSAPEELMRKIHAVYFQDKNGEQTENQPIT
ncbi:hypothetical protein H206_01274 [Candidatus Electrothrix aarhusensis]|uniref:Uncharacterized protein n=1 Tax=Candidatus Electrothrix aarhusensis TaxID=1859131 RepID=A0A3S4T7S1_9BACT|nr:hypothetical protein H206_01274 [Candidatus Electrothrix aarhusensis]